jgi:hypothetical protein
MRETAGSWVPRQAVSAALWQVGDSPDRPTCSVYEIRIRKLKVFPEAAGVGQAKPGCQPHGHRHAVSRHQQRTLVSAGKLFHDSFFKALRNLMARLPVNVIHTFYIRTAPLAKAALPGLNAADLVEPAVTNHVRGGVRGRLSSRVPGRAWWRCR